MRSVAVLGAGMVGGFVAEFLAGSESNRVKVVDQSSTALEKLRFRNPRLETCSLNVRQEERLRQVLQGVDLVVGALPGSLGYSVLESVIPHVPTIVDIGFMAEDASNLSDLAKQYGTRVVVDMGISPGLSNAFVGYAQFRRAYQRGTIYVGGLPRHRYQPFEYELVFSASDVIEEYTRPVRYLWSKVPVTKPALSEIETLDVPGVGTVEAFLTDGLRSLLKTSKIPTLVEKTLRYPGHVDLIKKLIQAGFLEDAPLQMNGHPISPRHFTLEILKNAWKPKPGNTDCLYLRVELTDAQGEKSELELYEVQESPSHPTAMAKTTGLPCALTADWLMNQADSLEPGVYPPEMLAEKQGFFEMLIQRLHDYGVSVKITL
jgi:saccharopine dehydrogenase-like NADP-dependent oxidoreductase